jgi:hypothetical protein
MERVHNIDIESMKEEILSEKMDAIIDNMGDGEYPIPPSDLAPGYAVIVENGVVVTVLTLEYFHRHHARRYEHKSRLIDRANKNTAKPVDDTYEVEDTVTNE